MQRVSHNFLGAVFYMRRIQTGFTLVELVIVIVILGIAAIITVPKFTELSTDAKSALTNSIAASLAAGNAVNYAARKAVAMNGVTILNCTDVAKTLQGGLPTGYSIMAATVSVDASISCTLTGPSSTTATFTATGII